MALKNKYQRQKQQYSIDGGMVWNDVSPANYRRGALIEAGSDDCNTVEWIEVYGSWFCIMDTEIIRWVQTETTVCENYDLYYIEEEEISRDGGETWESTGNTRTGQVADYDSEECTEGVDFSGQYFTIEYLEEGYFNPYSLYNFYLSFDNGETWNLGIDYGQSELIHLDKGDKVLVKREYTLHESVYSAEIGDYIEQEWNYMMDSNQLSVATGGWGKPTVPETKSHYNYKIYGNVGSLSYGDDFRNIDYTDKYFKSAEQIATCTSAYNLYIPQYREINGYMMFASPNAYNYLIKAPKTIQSSGGGVYLKRMFSGCTNLIKAPQLPDTVLKDNCYEEMFYKCTSLVDAPALPATTLTVRCYSNMFQRCTSLVTAPVLPATEGVQYAYNAMFDGCTSLTSITCYLKSLGSPRGYIAGNGWANGVPTEGTFNYNPANTDWEIYDNSCGVPYQWAFVEATPYMEEWREVSTICIDTDKYSIQVRYVQMTENGEWCETPSTREVLIESGSSDCSDFDTQYLTFKALENGTFTFTGTHYASGTSAYNKLSYSLDNGMNWTELASGTASPTVTAGNKIMWKGECITTSNGIGKFSSTGRFDVEGNVMSLLYANNFVGQNDLTGVNAAFYYLFNDDGYTNIVKIVNSENLVLPATTLSQYCYYGMFKGCTTLVSAPHQLPATTLTNYCYSNMFSNCTSLVTAPELPATTLASNCYGDMFSGCTSLVNAPELVATTLTNYCYDGMFSGCTSLTTAPELPATTLAQACYRFMFYDCTSLNYIKMLATDTSAIQCLNSWVSNVPSGGTFVKAASMTTLPTGINGIPSGWTVQDA